MTPTQWRVNKTAEDYLEPLDLGSSDKLYFKGDGVQEKIMQKLSRGKIPIENELDLHGMTVDVAQKELQDFLQSCQLNGCRYVRIVHGKGYGSANKLPILKNKLNIWLQNSNTVLAFCSAPIYNGGTGAVNVYIRRMRKQGTR